MMVWRQKHSNLRYDHHRHDDVRGGLIIFILFHIATISLITHAHIHKETDSWYVEKKNKDEN